MSKLYTEEQLRKAWNTAYVDALSLDKEYYKPIFYDDFIASLTPIELPMDEEIKEEVSKLKFSKEGYKGGVIEGMIWMRDKIQGGGDE